jgi:hypothetical protein
MNVPWAVWSASISLFDHFWTMPTAELRPVPLSVLVNGFAQLDTPKRSKYPEVGGASLHPFTTSRPSTTRVFATMDENPHLQHHGRVWILFQKIVMLTFEFDVHEIPWVFRRAFTKQGKSLSC